MTKPIEINQEESNALFSDHPYKTSYSVDNLSGVTVEYIWDLISGELNPLTRQDSRKYKCRARAIRERSGSILMDTGKFATKNRAEEIVNNFIGQQKILDGILKGE